ncbi:hypothetical protein ABZ379_47110 [Streptomyces canus]|uniref:hypothetical protein n=1 Tax=Streptomyces canus TaxID=58343 RepID=UPI00340B6905
MPNRKRKIAAVWALALFLTAGMGGVASAAPAAPSQALCPTSGSCYFYYIDKDYYSGQETAHAVNYPVAGACYPMDRAVGGQNWTNKRIILSQTTCEDGWHYDAHVDSHSSWYDPSKPFRAFVTPYDYE